METFWIFWLLSIKIKNILKLMQKNQNKRRISFVKMKVMFAWCESHRVTKNI